MAQPAAPLLPAPLAVTGHLVTFDPQRPEIAEGVIYIDDMGLIQGVCAATDPAPAGFGKATRVDTHGLVYPGLIDLHNHMAYNCLSLWIAPDRTVPWTRRDQWPNDPDYKPAISLPANALCHADGKAVLKYVETKAAVGGVTAIQGSAKLAHPFEGFMVRNVEFETFRGQLKKSVNQSVRPFASPAQYAAAKQDLDAGHAFLYHLAEGTDPALLKDYNGLRDHGCLEPKFIGIHSTALQQAQFTEWHTDATGGAIVWSPFSNLWLYGQTTDVVAARQAGMIVCLGADWSPSGSKSLLGELKVADLHNRSKLGSAFSPQEVCAMVTSSPALALGWQDYLGQLRAGLHGDFLVLADKGKDPYRTLIESTEPDVQLVAINGYPMYGTKQLMGAASAVNPEPVQVSPTLQRTVTLRDPRIPDADLSWPQVLQRLEAARANPTAARTAALQTEGVAEPPVQLVPDKHWDDPTEHPELLAEMVGVPIPPLDSLAHDAAYFAAVAKETLHGGQLAGLSAYYKS
ncbi:MAG: amidohydrolase family protein [Solirubrobacteraceae bacterium]